MELFIDTVIQPKLFISYAHADGESMVRDFWNNLSAYLKSSDRTWDKWDDKQILVGQNWDNTITDALGEGCNCCLLLVSDLFAKSSYILEREWPKTLARYEEEGIVFFPVVFGVLEGKFSVLPEELNLFQVYWPTVSELYKVPPEKMLHPDQVRLSYIDAMAQEAVKRRFLSRLADQMNARFNVYQRSQVAKVQVIASIASQINADQFVTNDSKEDVFAKAIFGSLSYEKRYQKSKSKGHYFSRQVDIKLNECLYRNGWILIEGHPLAGKTRAGLEAMKRLMSRGKHVVVWPFKAPDRVDHPLILPAFPDADYRIVWMDDIDTRLRNLARCGYESDDINCFLERIADMGIILAATARTGPTYYDFRHRFGLDDHLWDKLEVISMPRLEGEEEKEFSAWYLTNFKESLPDKFDHHPGSLFLGLETMRKRWEDMEGIARQHGLKLDVERAKDIMRVLHVFYVMEAYRPGGEFHEKDIRFYLRRMADKSQTSSAMVSAFAKTSFRSQPSGDDWEKMVRFLSQDQFHLGFLRHEGDSLFTETAYLDYIVAPDGERNIAQTVVESFSEEERHQLGLVVTPYNFSNVFRGNQVGDEKELEKLVRKLKPLGLNRQIFIWNQLLHLCSTLALAQQTMEMLKYAGIKPNVITYSMLLNKALTLDEGCAILAEMRIDRIKPNMITYYTMLHKKLTLDEGRVVLTEMRADGIMPDIVIYNQLLRKAQTLDECHVILAEMRVNEVKPNVIIYNKLVGKAQTLDECHVILAEMRVNGVKPNRRTYKKLLNKPQTIDESIVTLTDMRINGIKPNRFNYKRLLSKAQTIDERHAILSEMRNDRVTL